MKNLHITIKAKYMIKVADDFSIEEYEDVENALSDYLLYNNTTPSIEFFTNIYSYKVTKK